MGFFALLEVTAQFGEIFTMVKGMTIDWKDLHSGKLSKADILPTSEIIRDETWQQFRLSLKGRTTEDKLEHLKYWLEHGASPKRWREIQVTNYINALRRGGQIK